MVVLIDTHHYRPAFETHHTEWIAEHAGAYGSWIITVFVRNALLIVLRARSNESLRRKVGILWDLSTFWPRHVQPLACRRATPTGRSRSSCSVRAGTSSNNANVIISADSQGTVIAATAVLQLRKEIRGHVAFLTYGSPLQRLYVPWFPAFFDVATFEELGNRLPQRWDNLYRTTI